MTTPTDLDRLRQDAAIALRIQAAPERLHAAELEEEARRRAEQRQAARSAAERRIDEALKVARDSAATIPALLAAAVDGLKPLILAAGEVQRQREGAADAVVALSRIRFEEAVDAGADVSDFSGARIVANEMRLDPATELAKRGFPRPFDAVKGGTKEAKVAVFVLVELGLAKPGSYIPAEP